jgi:hypothetical protein
MAELARKAHLVGVLKARVDAAVDIGRIGINLDCNTDKLGPEIAKCAA